jgi:hypothetical protein
MMRSNPFATSFGKKTEERRDESGSDPQSGYGRFARVQQAFRAMAPRDANGAVPGSPALRGADQAAASRDAPVGPDTLATLRSWGLPDPTEPTDPHGPPAAAPDSMRAGAHSADATAADDDVLAGPATLAGDLKGADRPAPPAMAADAPSPAGGGASTAIDRLRAELGLDADETAASESGQSSEPEGSCPETWCRRWAAGISVAGRAARVHAAAEGSMRARSSRKGAIVSRVM